jgi:hypothetical protein
MPPAHPHRAARGGDVDDLAALGDLHLPRRGQPPGRRAGRWHQLPPALRVDGAGGLRGADRRAGPPVVEQRVDGPLQPHVDVRHAPSLRRGTPPRHDTRRSRPRRPHGGAAVLVLQHEVGDRPAWSVFVQVGLELAGEGPSDAALGAAVAVLLVAAFAGEPLLRRRAGG